ncbi:hypothetical protein CEUSTIGMA_g10402.t1 [Chlamydomonas eustigma]|uniref:Uncharacterized protein n=1 Tax=Chlamydomonas eustigma TaxID=1157962 RepID=A0A250XIR7_9CHLO|nr:hypothetical protein CEUSTIGMA_g10402.t1 [Chlamydomonas eustigma]|eukprot:GAX82975.1 hypothetical protein CEUSTIGMA_g10402.t1 [Chlamydomonas eustigma]
MPPSPYNKPITKFNQMKKKKVREAKKALGVVKVHKKVKVELVSSKRTKKNQRKMEHKQRCLMQQAAGSSNPKGAEQSAGTTDVAMEDIAKAAKREQAKLAKKARKANKMES